MYISNPTIYIYIYTTILVQRIQNLYIGRLNVIDGINNFSMLIIFIKDQFHFANRWIYITT